MSELESWRRWADTLDDAAFALLWRILGLLPAALAENPSAALRQLREQAGRAQELRWTLPRFGSDHARRLRRSTAQDWVDAWQAVIGTALDKVPLRIEGWESDEAVATTLALLGHVSPLLVCSVQLQSADEVRLAWPLRLAVTQAAQRGVLDAAVARWPSNRLSRIVEAGDGVTADLLLHRGDGSDLRARLERARAPLRARLILLVTGQSFDAALRADLQAAVTLSGAGGFVVVGDMSPDVLAECVNAFVERLSHAQRVDVAAQRSFAQGSGSVVVVLGDALARFTIKLLADRMLRRSLQIRGRGDIASDVRADLERVVDRLLTQLPSPPRPPRRPRLDAGSGSRRGGLESFGPPRNVGLDDGDAAFDYEAVEPAYAHESTGASVLAEAGELLQHAEMQAEAGRFLQQQSFVYDGDEPVAATTGFLRGRRALVRVRIGPRDIRWNPAPVAFPVHELPQEEADWDLQVWLSEPNHLRQPLKGEIRLGRSGASTTCDFNFIPEADGPFEGRLSVLHRGRVLQTVVLRACVHAADALPVQPAAPTLDSLIEVRQHLSDLDRRQHFDLAFVLNHLAEQPLVHALGTDLAWLVNLREIDDFAADLNKELSLITRSVADYAGGLTSAKGLERLRQLATIGSWIHLYLIEPLKDGGGAPDLAQREFLQVVSTRNDAIVVPFEFVYEYAAPDPNATLCGNWRTALETGRCPQTCARKADTVCPNGFWGISKVIERHAVAPRRASEGETGLQSEAVSGRDTLRIAGHAVYACSERVTDADLDAMRQCLEAAGIAAHQARDWNEWRSFVDGDQPSLLIALAHADGRRATATLEIGGQALRTIQISEAHLRSSAAGAAQAEPFVALLGCDMAGTGDAYANHVYVFRQRGAAVVVGTIATVLAEHSTSVAARLVQSLTFASPAQTRRLGETLRELKRRALLDGELMPLCLVAFGDADWLLSN